MRDAIGIGRERERKEKNEMMRGEDEDRTPESRQTKQGRSLSASYLVLLEILLQLRLLRLEGHFRG